MGCRHPLVIEGCEVGVRNPDHVDGVPPPTVDPHVLDNRQHLLFVDRSMTEAKFRGPEAYVAYAQSQRIKPVKWVRNVSMRIGTQGQTRGIVRQVAGGGWI